MLAILTGLEIDSAKSGIKPDLSQYLDGNRGRKSLFLRYKTIQQKSDSRKWYQPTKKERMDSFFGSVDWENVSSNLEKLPYYAKSLEEDTASLTVIPAKDEQLFAFAAAPGWKDKLDPNLMKRMEQLISAYEEAQRRCRNLSIEPDRMSRKNDILRILYALYEKMDGMPLREMDKIIYPVCTLCRDHERAGFIEGIKVGIHLAQELKDEP